MKEVPNIDRRKLWRFVNKKFKGKINHTHILCVINILFDEMVKDLDANKEVKIHNLGTIFLYKTKPKKYFDFVHQKVMQSNTIRRLLKFSLKKRLKDKIKENIDIDKTFFGD